MADVSSERKKLAEQPGYSTTPFVPLALTRFTAIAAVRIGPNVNNRFASLAEGQVVTPDYCPRIATIIASVLFAVWTVASHTSAPSGSLPLILLTTTLSFS